MSLAIPKFQSDVEELDWTDFNTADHECGNWTLQRVSTHQTMQNGHLYVCLLCMYCSMMCMVANHGGILIPGMNDCTTLSTQIVPAEKITLGLVLPVGSEIINIDSEEKKTIGSIFTESPYTLFILMRHYA